MPILFACNLSIPCIILSGSAKLPNIYFVLLIAYYFLTSNAFISSSETESYFVKESWKNFTCSSGKAPSCDNFVFRCKLADFNNNFTSAIAIPGKKRKNNKNNVKNSPIDPTKIPTSTQVGYNIAQEEGK